ncbi:MAG: glycosyltransferase [Ilumatobacteraceae bacterium]
MPPTGTPHDELGHAVRFDHLDRLCDQRGLFEHADGLIPREEHGYCTDDNARLLVVMSNAADVGVAHRLVRLSLDFVRSAQAPDGRVRNRMDITGRWTDDPTTEDCWGRALWGLGTAANHHGNPTIRRWAHRAFATSVRQRSPWSRAMAFAAIGAAELLAVDPVDVQARLLLVDALAVIGPVPSGDWTWPEPRLRYANAALAEAVIASAAALHDDFALDRGLAMLGWLLDLETRDGHLSVTGTAGRDAADDRAQFDQQPIEVAAMADACWRAYALTGDPRWANGVTAAGAWFHGDNDTGAVMHDVDSDGGFDGLRVRGVNTNQGAESTLAFVSTMQRVGALGVAP